MTLDRKSASARGYLQRSFLTFVQKREIFERRTRKSKLALKVIFFLSRPVGAEFGLSLLFYQASSSMSEFIFPAILNIVEYKQQPLTTKIYFLTLALIKFDFS